MILSVVPKWLLVAAMMLCSGLLVAETDNSQTANDLVSFPSEDLRVRYLQLNEELRCPKCQNQNLADSNSMIAQDLRDEVRRLLLAGNSDRQIKAHLVDRYGDFVLYNPPVKSSTWLLWLAPLALLFVMILIPVLLVRRKRAVSETPLDEVEAQQKLEALLSSSSEGSSSSAEGSFAAEGSSSLDAEGSNFTAEGSSNNSSDSEGKPS